MSWYGGATSAFAVAMSAPRKHRAVETCCSQVVCIHYLGISADFVCVQCPRTHVVGSLAKVCANLHGVTHFKTRRPPFYLKGQAQLVAGTCSDVPGPAGPGSSQPHHSIPLISSYESICSSSSCVKTLLLSVSRARNMASTALHRSDCSSVTLKKLRYCSRVTRPEPPETLLSVPSQPLSHRVGRPRNFGAAVMTDMDADLVPLIDSVSTAASRILGGCLVTWSSRQVHVTPTGAVMTEVMVLPPVSTS